MTRFLVLILALGLLAPAAASAGGFATVGLEPPPADLRPGDTWMAQMKILQHGRTPLDELDPPPTLRIFSGDAAEIVKARPTGSGGVWNARVTFPSAGRWDYEVHAFGATHGFAPVTVGDRPAAAAAPSSDRSLLVPLAAALVAALLVAALVRRRDTAVAA